MDARAPVALAYTARPVDMSPLGSQAWRVWTRFLEPPAFCLAEAFRPLQHRKQNSSVEYLAMRHARESHMTATPGFLVPPPQNVQNSRMTLSVSRASASLAMGSPARERGSMKGCIDRATFARRAWRLAWRVR